MGKAYVDFGTKRPGIYRLMFASAILVEAATDTTLTTVARGSFGQLVAALEDTKDRELRALKIWMALHGLVMLFNQGLLKGDLQRTSLDALVEGIFAR
jgi:hypothetical protein